MLPNDLGFAVMVTFPEMYSPFQPSLRKQECYLLQVSRAMDRIMWELFNSSIIIIQNRIYIKYAFSSIPPFLWLPVKRWL